GEQKDFPVAAIPMEDKHLTASERPTLRGQLGLALTNLDASPAERVAVSANKIVGGYLGAVLTTPEERAEWARLHPNPRYQTEFPRRGMFMSAEGAANSIPFGNTKLAEDSNEVDHEAVNAVFLEF